MKPLTSITSWLPMSLEEAKKRGWTSFDIILISGDAYIDHPSFGAAIIGRILEERGYRVGIISQPNWRDDLRDFKKLGEPKLFFAVTSGNMDSMVNHYTAFKRLRSDDAYTSGGKAGFRPDYASSVYSKILKRLFPNKPVILGGIEASMRRAAHYDYWSDTLKPSILVDSHADLLIYGMAEKAITKVAEVFENNTIQQKKPSLLQTAFLTKDIETINNYNNGNIILLPSYEDCLKKRETFANCFMMIEQQSNKREPSVLIQKTANKYLVINPPYKPLLTKDIDSIYSLPFTRLPHPRYKKRGKIPAYEMIKHSVTIHRGCFGGCSFCTISMHQGKEISSRSERSIMNEIDTISNLDDFKGVITDLGGPSANMYFMGGKDKAQCSDCTRPSCIYPKVCKNLSFDHRHLLSLYRRVSNHPKIKRVFIGSGIRYDMLIGHPSELSRKYSLDEYTNSVIKYHTSGRLKVAPEHVSNTVLKLIRKPPFSVYERFREKFTEINSRAGLKQKLVPYLMSSLPGCSIRDMLLVTKALKSIGYKPEQVQDFTPTPMTLSNVMYYSGIDPYSRNKLYVPRSEHEKREQNRLMFWYKEENKSFVKRKLKEYDVDNNTKGRGKGKNRNKKI